VGEWVKIKKTYIKRDEPSVTVTKQSFCFNAAMRKMTELDKNTYVSLFVNEEERKIAFEFKSTNDDIDDYKITSASCECRELMKKNWVSKVSELKKGQNVFAAKKETKSKWVITLCPSFEDQMQRSDSNKLNSASSGIYRYLDNGNIVYIGKGKIRDRLNSPERKNWKFDVIEYSVIMDDEQALQWEAFWIDRYKSSNNNQLPAYNMISGHG